MATSSRLDTARRQLRVARIGITAVAAAGFALFAVAARATHPATTNRSTSGSSAATTDQAAQSTSSFGFDSGSIGAGSSSPSLQSSGS
jgi:hypothetical protein